MLKFFEKYLILLFHFVIQSTMKRVNHLDILNTLLLLMKWMYDFRIRHEFSEAAMWDVLFIYIYCRVNSNGMSITALMMERYRRATGYKALRERLDVLIKRGLVIQENRRLYPAEKLISEIESLGNPAELKQLISSLSKLAA